MPTTAASAASGCTGLLRAFLGAAAFFGVGIGQLERAELGCQAKNQPCFSGSRERLGEREGRFLFRSARSLSQSFLRAPRWRGSPEIVYHFSYIDQVRQVLYRTINYFFTPRTVSFATLATRNFSTILAGILIFCCVLGFKPIRAFLFCFTSFPKPGKTNSPFFLISLYANVPSVSRNAPAVFLLV